LQVGEPLHVLLAWHCICPWPWIVYPVSHVMVTVSWYT